MKTTMNDLRPAPSALAFALLLIPMRFDDPAKPKLDLKVPLPTIEANEADPHVEMARIFGVIEQDMRQIDRLLSDASAGGAPAAGAEEKAAQVIAGIDELLAKSEKRSQAVLDGIDRLFELADHPHEAGGKCKGGNSGLCQVLGKSGGSSDKPSQSQGKSGQPSQGKSGSPSSPLDQQGGNTTKREATPGAPDKGGEKAGEDEKGKDGEKPGDSHARSGDPKGNQSSSLSAQDKAGAPPSAGAKGEASPSGTPVEKWGELPPHVRDVFRAQGGGDLPAPYRDWIDAYYRRLSKRSGS